MVDQQRIELAIAAITEDTILRDVIDAAPPQTILMPFAQDHRRHYISIAVFVSEAAAQRHLLLSACKRIYEVLDSRNLFAELSGFEISPFVFRSGRSQRTFKLSVLSSAFDRVEKLTAGDIGNSNLAEGITCILYNKDL